MSLALCWSLCYVPWVCGHLLEDSAVSLSLWGWPVFWRLGGYSWKQVPERALQFQGAFPLVPSSESLSPGEERGPRGGDGSQQGRSQEIPVLPGTLYPSLSSPGFLKLLCITERKHFGGPAVDWLLVAVWGFGVQSVAWVGVGSHSRGSQSRRWPHVLSGGICSSLCWVRGAQPRWHFSAGAERLWV